MPTIVSGNQPLGMKPEGLRRFGAPLAVLCLVLGSLLLYGTRLGGTLHADEIALGLEARALASTGRDIDGQFLPLFFHLDATTWLQPLPVYLTAVVLKALPFSETTLRTPTVLLAISNIVLVYVIAWRLLENRPLAFLAGVLLMATPAHFILGRLALGTLHPVTCLLLWLLSLLWFLERPRALRLYIATLWLGVGFYTQPVAVLMMPLYVGLTLGAAYWTRRDPSIQLAGLGGFLTPLILLLPWFVQHPATFAGTLDAWGLHLGHPLGSLRDSFSWRMLSRHSSLYWDYLSPAYLFMRGADSLVASTHEAGVFVGSTAILIASGVHWIATECRHRPQWRLILFSALIAPIAATAFDEPRLGTLALSLVPFGVLIAAAGARRLLTSTAPARAAGVLALCLLAFQFARFHTDYVSAYRGRSMLAFDRNADEAVSRVLALVPRGSPIPSLFFSAEIPHVMSLWTFTLAKNDRDDLRLSTTYLDPRMVDAGGMPPGSIVLTVAGGATEAKLLASRGYQRIATTADVTGAAVFVILVRVAGS
jgi:4-amino-4-deoxy-L-arabinose transferase-like glycosyltransferase